MQLQRSFFERLLMLLGWTDLDIRRRHNRLDLRKLSDAELEDLGLERSEADGRIREQRP